MNKKLLYGLIIPLLAVAIVSAGLLAYYGSFSFSANVAPAITVDGETEYSFTHDIPEIAPGGESFCFLHKVDNDASIPIDLELEHNFIPAGLSIGMYGVEDSTTLELCPKDESDWSVCDGSTIDLTFDPVSPTFDYELDATGLTGDYAIIYYPDVNADKDWNAENIVVIDTFTGGSVVNNSVDLGMNLPDAADYNVNPSPNYCNMVNGFDDYEHCRGAKIWIVPTSDITDGELNTWNPDDWLFETDLITYSDCSFEEGLPFAIDMNREDISGVLETKSHEMLPMLICYDFDVMAEGEYDVTSELLPVSP